MPKSSSLRNAAEQVTVRDAGGITVPGWGVREDTVVAIAGGLREPVSVRLGGKWITAERLHQTAPDGKSDQPWIALELPSGSLAVAGEKFPPLLPQATSDVTGDAATMKAQVPFWCLVFPLMKGCRR
ncbi:MAG TPA: hypothetical protein PKE40_08165 [Arachnia sp.]|nr:hypothetical protein [Arachnia sp.]HMT86310.1 hypothetical protein [Arachnia sp.]